MSCYNKTLRSTLLIFKKKFWFREFQVWKSLCIKGVITFFVETVLSPSNKSFRRGTLLCFRKFPVSKTFKKNSRGNAYQDFLSKMFCLTLPMISMSNPSVFQIFSGMEKRLVLERGALITILRQKVFRLMVQKKIFRAPLWFWKNSDFEKFQG